MSIEAESIDHERDIETSAEEQVRLLKAVIAGLALILDVEPELLIKIAEDL